jgi:hypothetical protein
MIQGPEPGSYHKLPDNRVTTIGRSSRNSVRVVSPSVSRFHCEIACVNGEWILSDLNSKKGTIVNGEPVADRTALRRGDIIRLSSAVFRFDRVSESVQEDGALVAIREAELDSKLRVRGAVTGSLDDIRERSRLAASPSSREGGRPAYSIARNLTFLAGVVVAVAAIAAGILLVAYSRRGSAPTGATSAEGEAARARRQATASIQAGRTMEGLRELARIPAQYPGTEAARAAERQYEATLWKLIQKGFDEIVRHEEQGHYSAALRVCDRLADLPPAQGAQALVRRRRDYTERLAHAAFRHVQRRADEMARRGERARALELYRAARERIGLPELAARAGARIAELESSL